MRQVRPELISTPIHVSVQNLPVEIMAIILRKIMYFWIELPYFYRRQTSEVNIIGPHKYILIKPKAKKILKRNLFEFNTILNRNNPVHMRLKFCPFLTTKSSKTNKKYIYLFICPKAFHFMYRELSVKLYKICFCLLNNK